MTTTTHSPLLEEKVCSTASPYQLLHMEEDKSCLKVTIASIAYNIPIVASGSEEPCLMKFLHGPGIYHKEKRIFGGNAICKTFFLLENRAHAILDEIDDWLEYERECLRPWKAKCLKKLENELQQNGSYYLVGDILTPADICIVSALQEHLKELPCTVEKYVLHHTESNIFEQGKNLLKKVVSDKKKIDFASNPSILLAIESIFRRAIQIAFPIIQEAKVLIKECNNPKHGDYQCNSAMPIFQQVKNIDTSIKTPQECAQAIIDSIQPNIVVENLSVNGPGFILCRVQCEYLQQYVNHVLHNGLPSFKTRKEIVVVDFSSPNIAKEMHVGHLRSTIIGEAVCRILEFCECDVHRVNHLGDWGTQFGMLIQYLKEEHSEVLNSSNSPNSDDNIPSITNLTAFYKSAKERFDSSPEFKAISQENVVRLQSGDEDCRKIWNLLCDISRSEFSKVYKRLDVQLYECGESFYNDKIPSVITELEDKELITIEEGGAKCLFVPKSKIPLMVQKSNGGYGYDSTDLAALRYRVQDLKANKIIYITDFSQGDHFKMIFEAGKLANWVSDQSLQHIGFGTVQGEDGKRFKTRSGDTVRLVDLLDEAVSRMKTQLIDRLKDNKANIEEHEVDHVASILGYSAVKYFDLRRNPTTNYVFSYDRMLDTKGNTAIYLLYQHVRLESICRKALKEYNVNVEEVQKAHLIQIQSPSEKNLALNLLMFWDVINLTLGDMYPFHICDYLYSVSNAVGDFVTQCKVLGTPQMESRLLLCRLTAIVMRKCYELLGIQYVMKI